MATSFGEHVASEGLGRQPVLALTGPEVGAGLGRAVMGVGPLPPVELAPAVGCGLRMGIDPASWGCSWEFSLYFPRGHWRFLAASIAARRWLAGGFPPAGSWL